MHIINNELKKRNNVNYFIATLLPYKFSEVFSVISYMHMKISDIVLYRFDPILCNVQIQWWYEQIEKAYSSQYAVNDIFKILVDVIYTLEIPKKFFDQYFINMQEQSSITSFRNLEEMENQGIYTIANILNIKVHAIYGKDACLELQEIILMVSKVMYIVFIIQHDRHNFMHNDLSLLPANLIDTTMLSTQLYIPENVALRKEIIKLLLDRVRTYIDIIKNQYNKVNSKEIVAILPIYAAQYFCKMIIKNDYDTNCMIHIKSNVYYKILFSYVFNRVF